MRLISVNVGLPREAVYKGKRVTTGIFKEPVEHRVMLRSLNLDGDRQADLSVHGGSDKAVYAYPAEHYAFWHRELSAELPWGMFGENLTTSGLREDSVRVGDRFRIGGADVMVTGPRLPCFKLALKFGRDDMVKRFLASGRTGFYLKVVEEGEVGGGDPIALIGGSEPAVTVEELVRLYARERGDLHGLSRLTEVEALPESWRDWAWERIEKLSGKRAARKP